MNRDVTAQRLTSAHPLSFLLWTEGGDAAINQYIIESIHPSVKIYLFHYDIDDPMFSTNPIAH